MRCIKCRPSRQLSDVLTQSLRLSTMPESHQCENLGRLGTRYFLTKVLKVFLHGAQMAIFRIIFASCISSEPRAAHFRPAF